jgi:hypothetical protein
MAYLGNAPARSFISFERQVFTIVNSQTAYTLDHSVNNENDLRLVINNIVQEPGSGKAYTASGTTLTLSAALVNGTDEMYCVFLGRATATNAPGAGSVGTSQLASDAVTEAKIADDAVESEHLNDNVISGQTELAAEPADTDEFLVSDAGTLKRVDYSYIKGGGITMAQQWRLTSDLTGDANPISSNLEVVDTDGYGGIGSSMSVSSGTFTFPSTGIYHITFNFLQQIVGTADYAQGKIRTTTDNSTYDDAAAAYVSASSTATAFNSGSSTHIFDVTDTSTHKVQFRIIQANTANKVRGTTSQTWTGMTFIRLGDT